MTYQPHQSEDTSLKTAGEEPSPTDKELTLRFTRCAYPGPNPMYRCNRCGAEEFGVRNLLVSHALACGVPVAPAGSIEDAIRAARNSAFEAAAQACDAERERLLGIGGTGFDTASSLGRRIRKLKVDAPGVLGTQEPKDTP